MKTTTAISSNIDYAIRIDRFKQLIVEELKILAELDSQNYEILNKQYVEYLKEKSNALEIEYKRYQLLRSSINAQLPFHFSTLDTHILEKISEKKASDSDFKKELTAYVELLKRMKEAYQESNFVKKFVKENRPHLQKLSSLVKHRLAFIREFLARIESLTFESLQILEAISELKACSNSISKIKDEFNSFVNTKKKETAEEERIIKKFTKPFEEFLNKTKEALGKIIISFDSEQKNYKKFSDKIEAGKYSSLIKLFEKLIPELSHSTKSLKKEKRSSVFLSFRKSLTVEEVKTSTRSFSGLTEIVKEINKIATREMLFSYEYMLINKLAYLRDNKESLGEQIELIRAQIILLNKQDNLTADKIFFKEKLQWLTAQNLSIDQEQICDSIITSLNVTSYLPKTWEKASFDPVFRKFPSSGTHRLDTMHSAHYYEKVVALAGPSKTTAQYRNNILHAFFEVFFVLAKKDIQVAQILALGADFEPYLKDGEYNGIKVSVENTNKILLKKDGETLVLYYNQIKVPDNHSLNLDYEELKTLLNIYNNCSSKHPIAIHCASGVGRTGQVRNIFSLLDILSQEEKLRQKIDSLLDNDIHIHPNDLNDLGKAKRDILCTLRQIRYAEQELSQDLNCLPLLLLLRAMQRHLADENSFTKEDIINLREELIKIWSLPNNALLDVDDVTAFTFSISSTANILPAAITEKPLTRARVHSQEVITPIKWGLGAKPSSKPQSGALGATRLSNITPLNVENKETEETQSSLQHN